MSSPRVVLFCLSLVTLVAVTAAGAARNPMEDGTLTVRAGRGTVTLKFRGSLIGRLSSGKLTVLASPYGTTTSVVRGWETRTFSTRGTVYGGSTIRFRVADDRRITVKLNGKGLNFSAVGKGDAWIDGAGNPNTTTFFDGTYSLNGEAYKSLPDVRTKIELKAPSPPPPPPAPARG